LLSSLATPARRPNDAPPGADAPRPSSSTAATAAPPPVERPRVLLIDDQPAVARAVEEMIKDAPEFDFHYCSDARRALLVARQIKPTVILQDLVMPDMNGAVLLRFLRADPFLVGVPIIMLSSREDPRDKSRAFTDGANDYLVKLPDRIELVARLRTHARSYIAGRERDAALRTLEALKIELEKKNEELARLSTVDGLTAIANRRRFDEVLELEWRKSARRGEPLSLIMIDVDHFKRFNDRHGHLGGDACLRRVAACIDDTGRRPSDLAARYGGEEFALLLPSTDLAGATQLAGAVIARIMAEQIPHGDSDVSPHVTVSLGVASVLPTHPGGPEDLIARADGALYEAKRAGRACWHAAPG
jgi:two-component system chemotaxis family response regulator WspR